MALLPFETGITFMCISVVVFGCDLLENCDTPSAPGFASVANAPKRVRMMSERNDV